jgi:HAD superfamily hydrolase (TIGR01490 family)
MSLVFFDMDDTLLAGDAEAAWAKYMVENGIMQDEGFTEKIRRFDEDYRRGDLDFSVYTEFLLSPIKGMTVQEVQDIVQPFCLTIIEEFKDSTSQGLLDKHSSDECLITSGTLSFIVTEIADLLGIRTFFGTDAEVKEGRYTGRVSGRPNFGEEKVRKIKNWLGGRSLSETIAYSDSINDLPLLEFSSKAVVLNPDSKLREVARSSGWEIDDSRNA